MISIYLGRGFNAIASVATAVVAARLLGPAGYGYLAFLVAFVALGQMVAGLGMATYLVREFPRLNLLEERRALFGRVLTMQFVAVPLLLLPLALATRLLAPSQAIAALPLAFLGSFALTLSETEEGAAAGSLRFGTRLVPSLVRNLLCAPLILLMGVVIGRTPYAVMLAMVLAQWIGAVVGGATVLSRVAWPSFRSTRSEIIAGVRQGAGFFMLPLLGLLYFRSDIWLLVWLAGPAAAGIYQAGYNFLDGVLIVPAGLILAWLARLSGLWHRAPDQLIDPARRLLPVFAVVGLGMATALLACNFLIRQFYPGAFLQTQTVIPILVLTVVPCSFNLALGNLLLVVDGPKWPVTAMAAGLLANVVLNIVMIPRLGVAGSAWATVMTECLALAAQAVAVRNLLPGLPWVRYVVFPVVAGIAVSAATLYEPIAIGLPDAVGVIAGGIATLIGLVVAIDWGQRGSGLALQQL